MSKVSSRGQITIPVEIQRKMGMGPGTEIEFVQQDGSVVLQKRSGIDRVYGSLKLGKSTDELIEEMRGPVPDFVKKLAAERERDHRHR